MDCNSRVCRTCLSCKVELISIFEDNVANILGICNFLEVTLDDGLPNKICESCKSLTLQSYCFKQQCEISESKLRNCSKSEDFGNIIDKRLDAESNLTFNSNEKEEIAYDQCDKSTPTYFDSESEDKVDVEEFIPFLKTEQPSPLLFVCKECNQSYISEYELKLHYSVHETESEYDAQVARKSLSVIRKPLIFNSQNLEESNDKSADNQSLYETDENFYKEDSSDSDSENNLPFNCKNCRKSFNLEHDLKIHEYIHEDKSNDYECPICKKELKNDRTFNSHITIHMLEKPHVCSVCNKGFAMRFELNKHFKIHKGIPNPNSACKTYLPFKCNKCENSFNLEHDLKLHEYIHEDKSDDFKCPICKKELSTKYVLKFHMTTHMLEKPYVCNVCNKGFAMKFEMKRHIKIIHESLPIEKHHICKYCGKRYPVQSQLNMHMKSHTGEKPFKCDDCGKSFSVPTYLKAHSFIHTGERRIKCDICKKTFAQKSCLKLHMRIHTGEKPYICKECGKCFNTPSSVRAHERTHNNDKPHVCNYCSNRFKTKGALEVHIRTHTGEKPFICEQCGKAYNNSAGFKIHIEKHLGIKKFICTFCNKDFPVPSKLRRHMRTHTGEKPSTCTYCNKNYFDKATLKKHIKRFHENVKDILNKNKSNIKIEPKK